MAEQWHDSWTKMKVRPFILVVCPQAVESSWEKAVGECTDQKPWQHQTDAADFARARRSSMLAMDMGTGKTLTALLATDFAFKKKGIRFLGLCKGTNKSRAAKLERMTATTDPLVVVCNYESVWRGDFAKVVEKTNWSCVLLDESHRIKSPGGKASRWLAKLARNQPKAKLLCLTGTPMPHSPLDLYGQFRFLDPTVFGTSFSRMRSRYAVCDQTFPSKVLEYRNQEELTRLLDQNSWRVSSDEVLDLPKAIHQVVDVELRASNRKVYRQMEDDMVAQVGDGEITASNALTKLLRLQQVTSGYLMDEGMVHLLSGTPEKILVLEDMLKDLPTAEPVVVFCRFRHDLNEVAALCSKMGRGYSEVSGVTKSLEEWQQGDTQVIGIQIQSGGAGIDLTRAAYCFYYSIGFSLGEYEQSLARLRRPGQDRMVRYYHLVAKNTVDQRVYKALKERKNVVQLVLENLTQRIEEEAAA